jgi:hypothetical protein
LGLEVNPFLTISALTEPQRRKHHRLTDSLTCSGGGACPERVEWVSRNLVWGAHASRVLAMASSQSRTLSDLLGPLFQPSKITPPELLERTHGGWYCCTE